MNSIKTTKPGGVLLALLLGVGLMPAAWAQTAANTAVTNTASVGFTVGGVAQTGITSNTDSFLVDRLIDVKVTETTGTATTVVPDQTTFSGANGVIRFTITNEGNDTQDIAVVATNQADGTDDDFALAGTDSWNTVGAFAYYLDDGDGLFEPGTDDAALPSSAGTSYLDEVASGGIRRVWVEPADVPANDPGNTLDGDPDKDMDNGNFAVVSMAGTVRAGGGAAALGAALTNDSASADVAGTVQNVFGDGTGEYDGNNDATDSDDDVFQVSNAVITISKSSAVISDPINGGTNPKRIPGATIRYTIVVANAAAAASAASVIVSDAMPGSTTYVSPSITLDTVADPDANAGVGDCDFAITAANTVTCDFATLPASTTRTITYDVTVN